jgi:hypothetical protein
MRVSSFHLFISLFLLLFGQSLSESPSKRAKSLVKTYEQKYKSSMSAANDKLRLARKKVVQGSDQPLNPFTTFLTDKDRMKLAIGKKNADAALVQRYHEKIPKGAHLHIHFNAVLPGTDVWYIAVVNERTKISKASIKFEAMPNKNLDSCKGRKGGDYYRCLIPISIMTINEDSLLGDGLKASLDQVRNDVRDKDTNFLRDHFLRNQIYFPDWNRKSPEEDLDKRAEM